MQKILKVYRNLWLEKRVSISIVCILISLSIVSLVSFLGIRVSSIISNWEDKVYKGVTINGLDVSRLSEASLKEFLVSNFSDDMPEGSVQFSFNDKSISIPYSELGITYDYDKAVYEALSFSENLTYTQKLNQIFNPKKTLEITLVSKFNIGDKIDALYEKLSREFNIAPIDAQISIVDGQPVVVRQSSQGVEIDKDALIMMINDMDPSSASNGGMNVPTRSVDPKYSSEVLGKINGRLSTYSTSYKSSSNERATNVELSAKAINGVVLMPGETFSFNKTVGPRTRERGYRDAAIIVGNVYESGLGGGICQTSSTLHQAVFRAGIIPSQRKNHSLPTSYMPLGFDAAVAWGSLDYVFKNPYDFPILIDVSTEGRNLTISIYGDVTKVNKSYSTVTETYESVPYSTKYVNDNTLPKGKQVVKKNGVNGTKVRVYAVIKDKYTGEVLEKKHLWNDYYVPQDKIVNVGTK